MVANGAPIRISWGRVLTGPTPEQMFDLVRDIESYPRFVPGCIAARIVEREANRWIVDNVFGLGPIRSRFSSIATFTAPEALDIRSVDGPWRTFDMGWRFTAIENGCHVHCTTAFDFHSPILARVAAVGFEPAQAAIIEAFLRRATALYGAHT